MFGLFFTTVTLGLDPGVSSLSSSGAFFFIVILGRNASRGSPLQIPVSSTGMTNKELSLSDLFFFLLLPGLFFLLSLSDLIRQSNYRRPLKLQNWPNGVDIGLMVAAVQTVTEVKVRGPRDVVGVLRRRPVTTARIRNTSYL